MTSGFRALWVLLLPAPQPRLPKQSWWSGKQGVRNFLILLIVFSLACAYLLSGLGQTYKVATTPDHPAAQSLGTWGVTKQQIDELNIHRMYNQLSKSEIPRKMAPVALVGPPEMTQIMHEVMDSQGISPANTGCIGCVVLEWYPNRGWHAEYVQNPDATDVVVPGEAISLISDAIKAGVAQQHQQTVPSITVDPAQIRPAVMGVVASSLRGVSHFLLLALAWVLVISMGLRGYKWDVHRSTGKLEPLVTAQHQAWILYASQLSHQTVACFIFFGVFLGVSWVFEVPLHWPFALALWMTLPFFCFAVGLWGVLATVLFHHPKGRMFSRFLLSPIIIGMMWTIRLYVLLVAMRWKSPLLAWTNQQRLESDWPYVLLSIPALIVLSAILFWIIQLRIGSRRQGLRKAV